MGFFRVDKKTGFKVIDSRKVLILDSNGIPFYYKELNPKKGYISFNLPQGLYETENNLIRLDSPIKYKAPKLKKPYAQRPLPENGFEITYGNNPNKCTVDLDKGTLFFDESFRGVPKVITDYIIYHEYGHYFYRGRKLKSEKHCDNFAVNCLLEKGYNPTQIHSVLYSVLSDGHSGTSRKRTNLRYLQKSKSNA